MSIKVNPIELDRLKKATDYRFEKPDLEVLKTFLNPGVDQVLLTQREHTSLCPVTGQPDYATVTIGYRPDKLCVESKSLKLYLMMYRNEGTFCESSCVKIFRDLDKVLVPKSLEVEIIYEPRGGITISAIKESYGRIEKHEVDGTA